MLMEGQIQEEQIELEKDQRIEFWLHLVRTNQTPSTARISLNAITSRSLAKALWDNSSIVALDVSRMKLSDIAGAYLCRALRNNTSIVKLDLESNYFGPKTCKTLADSLTTNTTVTHVNLESNLLSRGAKGHDIGGVEAMAEMLKTNTTLVYLNMWRCGVASEGGHKVVTGMGKKRMRCTTRYPSAMLHTTSPERSTSPLASPSWVLLSRTCVRGRKLTL